ncbi:histidinol-phosphatase [Desulfosarcina sp. OttesenSCG-928-A07]|nr:histidinol-phosphatase [Desulfosarcina sp. OttesenSCG-928-A07]
MNVPERVSIHGGHSGQFCCHAKDTLEAIIKAYIRAGFSWVGITEHMPPPEDRFVFLEEKNAGLDASALKRRFGAYIRTCRQLQARYAERIRVFVGVETEACTGAILLAKALISEFSPDYVVGSVHHVKDIPFDASPADYEKAAARCGGVDGLYTAYFDAQYAMIQELKPQVVGHLDVIRIYDPDWRDRLLKPVIWEKIERNLELIKKLNLILDFNLRPLFRGENEPYLFTPILEAAGKMGIDVVPGDDSHGVANINSHYLNIAIERLRAAGISTQWRMPIA